MRNSLVGKWNIADRDGITWEFTELLKLRSPSGVTLHGGRLREWDGGKLADQTEYLYTIRHNRRS